MTTQRLKRPTLERDRPIRTWATLFGPQRNGFDAVSTGPETDHRATNAPNGALPFPIGPNPSAQSLAEAVEAGYRVVNQYIRHGQTVAQAMSPGAGAAPTQQGVPADMQQLSQRVMQYGWDFAGLWFEMFTRMGGNATGWPSPASEASATRPEAGGASGAPGPTIEMPVSSRGISISVVAEGRTAATIEVRPGAARQFLVQPLRGDSDESPPIREVTIESAGADGVLSVKVVIPPTQPPGVYNGLVIDSATKRPRGTLSVEVFGAAER